MVAKGSKMAPHRKYRFGKGPDLTNYTGVRIPGIKKPRQQHGWIIQYGAKWVLTTFKKIKGINENVGRLIERHIMLAVYRSMRMRAPKDTGRLRKSIKYIKLSAKQGGYNASSYLFDARSMKGVYIKRDSYEMGVNTGAKPRTTIQSAYYQEKGYVVNRFPAKWLDINSRYFNENRGALIRPTRHKAFIVPTIESIWSNKERLKSVLDKAFKAAKKDFEKLDPKEKAKYWKRKRA